MKFMYFCYCGVPVYKERGCAKHGYGQTFETMDKKYKRGKYSGLSKSENAFNEYK